MELNAGSVDLLSAALRHVRDAEWLLAPTNPNASVDQAYHLAGYGPECARKATLSDGRFNKSIGHRFGAAVEDVVDVAVALDRRALRYEPRDWGRTYPELIEWREDVRYRRTGETDPEKASALVEQARKAVDRVVLALWMDGRLPPGEEPW